MRGLENSLRAEDVIRVSVMEKKNQLGLTLKLKSVLKAESVSFFTSGSCGATLDLPE